MTSSRLRTVISMSQAALHTRERERRESENESKRARKSESERERDGSNASLSCCRLPSYFKMYADVRNSDDILRTYIYRNITFEGTKTLWIIPGLNPQPRHDLASAAPLQYHAAAAAVAATTTAATLLLPKLLLLAAGGACRPGAAKAAGVKGIKETSRRTHRMHCMHHIPTSSLAGPRRSLG